jgi:hypothetical protein
MSCGPSGVAYTALFITIVLFIIIFVISFTFVDQIRLIEEDLFAIENQFRIQVVDVPLVSTSPIRYQVNSGAIAYTFTGIPPVLLGTTFTIEIDVAIAALGRPFYIINSTPNTIPVIPRFSTGVSWVDLIGAVILSPGATAAFVYVTTTTVIFIGLGEGATASLSPDLDVALRDTRFVVDLRAMKRANKERYKLKKH